MKVDLADLEAKVINQRFEKADDAILFFALQLISITKNVVLLTNDRCFSIEAERNITIQTYSYYDLHQKTSQKSRNRCKNQSWIWKRN